MIELVPRAAADGLRVLAIAAHADDIEIGAGGALLSWIGQGSVARLDWVVLSAEGIREQEATDSAQRCLERVSAGSLTVSQLPERHFHAAIPDVKRAVSAAVDAAQPDLVLCPSLHDVHQDHRATAEAVQQACRDHLVLHYEIAKYEGDLRTPNVYVPFDAATMQAKIDWLNEAFPSQHSRQWFDDELFRGLCRIRGVECVSTYAEGFHCRKMTLGAVRKGEQ